MEDSFWGKLLAINTAYLIVVMVLYEIGPWSKQLNLILFWTTIIYIILLFFSEDIIKLLSLNRIYLSEEEDVWFDKNNNSWEVKYFDQATAKALSRNLRSCYNCFNCCECAKCNNCFYCVGCVECTDCVLCDSCYACDNCDDCYNESYKKNEKKDSE